MLISDLTYKVVAYSEIKNYNTDECVDWAIEMIALGHDTEHVLILAGLHKPTNYFETVNILKIAIGECGLEMKTGKEGIISYNCYFIKQIAKFINVKENLLKISESCIDNDYDRSIFDFYLLRWAWSDLDWGNLYTEYWPGANINNVEQIVVAFAGNWLSQNESYYLQRSKA